MTVEYTVETETESLTLPGELTTYPDNTVGEDTTFEFYIKGGPSDEATYQAFKELQKYAAFSTVEKTIESVSFTEPSDFDRADNVNSLLVQVTPGSSVTEAGGVWGIVTNVTDSTQTFGAIARIELTVTVLADADEYDAHAAVKQAFSIDPPDVEETTFEFAFESAFVG